MSAAPRRGLWLGAAGIVVAVGIGAATLLLDDDRDRPVVRTAPVTKRDLTSKVLAQGRVRARTQVEVASEIGGRVASVDVKVGDVVKKGDPLFALDDEQLKNGVEQLRVGLSGAEAVTKRAGLAVAEAERGVERDQKLREKGVLAEDALKLSQSRLDLARAEQDQASAGLERTKLDLSRARDTLRRARVTAPIAGTVVAVGVEVGQVVSAVSGISASGDLPGLGYSTGASSPIVIADLDELIVRLEVDELDVGQVKLDQHAKVTAQGIKEWEFAGTVERVGLMGREQAGAVLFAIEVGVTGVSKASSKRAEKVAPAEGAPDVALPLPRDLLRPGMSAQAEIEVETLTGALTVPVASVLEGDGDEKPDRVFTLDGETAHRTDVKLGASEDDRIAVLSGLSEGQIVVEGPFRALKGLEDGARVKIDNTEKKDGDKDGEKKP